MGRVAPLFFEGGGEPLEFQSEVDDAEAGVTDLALDVRFACRVLAAEQQAPAASRTARLAARGVACHQVEETLHGGVGCRAVEMLHALELPREQRAELVPPTTFQDLLAGVRRIAEGEQRVDRLMTPTPEVAPDVLVDVGGKSAFPGVADHQPGFQFRHLAVRQVHRVGDHHSARLELEEVDAAHRRGVLVLLTADDSKRLFDVIGASGNLLFLLSGLQSGLLDEAEPHDIQRCGGTQPGSCWHIGFV